MKLAEALQERADLNRKIEQLDSRLCNNCLVQEGEKPLENPEELLQELEYSVGRLEYLMERINITNSKTLVDGKTMTACIFSGDASGHCLSIDKCLTIGDIDSLHQIL